MNPEKPSREEIEAKLTALLLGELPAEEAQLLRWAISQDAALAKMHDRLKVTIGFVSEVAANPAESIPAQTAPLKLSGERREKLLAHFKTIAPREFVPLVPPLKKRQETSWLTPLAIAAVVVLVAIGLASVITPNFVKARATSQANANINKLRQLDAAKDQFALENKNLRGAIVLSPTPPPAAPQAALDQRVSSLEAYVSATEPTASGGDAWKKQTIVLPASATAAGDLTAASPAQSEFFNSGSVASTPSAGNAVNLNYGVSGVNLDREQAAASVESGNRRIGGGFGGGGGGRGGGETYVVKPGDTLTKIAKANGTTIEALEDANNLSTTKILAGAKMKLPAEAEAAATALPAAGFAFNARLAGDTSAADGFTHDDFGGLKYLTSEMSQSEAQQNQIAGQSRFYRNTEAPGASAGKVPMLGDVPLVGGLFKSSPANQDGDIGSSKNLGEEFRNTPVVDGNGNITLADDLSKSGTGTLALNGVNTYNGATIISGGTLNLSATNSFSSEPMTGKIYNDGLVVAGGKFDTGLTKDDMNGLRDLLTTNNVQFENNGTIGAAPALAETQPEFLARKLQLGVNVYAQEQARLESPAPVAAPLVSQNSFQARLTSQNQVAAASPSVVLPPNGNAPITVTRRMPVFNTTAGTQGSPAGSSVTYTNVSMVFIGGMPYTDTVQVALAPPVAAPAAKELTDEDRPIQKTPSPAPVPQPEILTRENAFSTFSLNVSDVSFKLAAASLERGQLPDAASIRSEEFINAFDYRDPEPAAGVPVAFVAERARDPFAHNRDLLRFSIKTAAAGREAGRPLNLVLLLDNSGSMERADRVAIIHEALKVLASQLQPQDTLSIVTFARTARLWVDGARGDQAGTAVNKVSDLTPEGGTNLEEAMNLAYATARRHYLANGGNRVVLLTDGAANLGNVDPEALKQKVESFRKQGIALDCFGIGWEGYNDDLLEVLSSNGDGRYGFINTPEAATTEFAAQLAGALHVAAEDVKVQVEFNPQRVISYRQIGYAKHQLTKEQFRDNTVAAAPLAAREAGNALYTVEVNPQGTGPVATVRVRCRVPGTTDVSEHEWQVPFDGAAPALEQSSSALRLVATASAFSEWLAQSQFAQEVTTDQLLNYLNGVPAIYGADARPKQLETMIREAKSLSGK